MPLRQVAPDINDYGTIFPLQNMDWTPTATMMVLTTLALCAVNFFQTARCELKSRNYDKSELRDTEFRISKLYYSLSMVPIGLGIVTSVTAAGKPAAVLRIVLGCVVLAFGVVLVLFLARTSVSVTKERIVIRYGKHQEVILIKDIKSVRISGTLIVVDTGKVPHKMIPMVYGDVARMLALIRHYGNVTDS